MSAATVRSLLEVLAGGDRGRYRAPTWAEARKAKRRAVQTEAGIWLGLALLALEVWKNAPPALRRRAARVLWLAPLLLVWLLVHFWPYALALALAYAAVRVTRWHRKRRREDAEANDALDVDDEPEDFGAWVQGLPS
jgi:hypothetical protein